MSSYSFLASQPAPQDLDYLINDLRFPPKDSSVRKVLGYLLHYLPYVKQEQNLRLLIAAFLNNPVCFGRVVDEGQGVLPQSSAPAAAGSGAVGAATARTVAASATPSRFHELYLIIEVFKLIADTKLKVSQPSISIKAWYTILLKELTHFAQFNPALNGWKVLPIIAGLKLANPLRDELYVRPNPVSYYWFFQSWDRSATSLFKAGVGSGCLSPIYPRHITDLSLMSLAIFHDSDQNILSFTSGVASERFIVHRLVDLFVGVGPEIEAFFFAPGAASAAAGAGGANPSEIWANPAVKHLNRISLLLESYLKRLPVDANPAVNGELIDYTMVSLLALNRHLNHLSANSPVYNTRPGPGGAAASSPAAPAGAQLVDTYWMLMKSLLFGQVVIFQGILTGFLTQTNTSRRSARAGGALPVYREFALKILHNLYYMNFVLLSIGQGGFDSYNFVFYLALEVALDGGHSDAFEHLTMALIGDYREVNLYLVHRDYIVQSKALFVLGLWENYLNQQKQKRGSWFAQEKISPVCFELASAGGAVKSSGGTSASAPVGQQISSDVIEASHSVLLALFSDKKNLRKSDVLDYLDLILRQFPLLLSANQLSIAVETLGKFTLSSTGGIDAGRVDFLEILYVRCANVPPGRPLQRNDDNTLVTAQPIAKHEANSTWSHIEEEGGDAGTIDIIDANKTKKPKDIFKKKDKKSKPPAGEHQFQDRLTPQTVREAMIFAFLNLIPYLPLTIFVRWLNKTWILIQDSNRSEADFLVKILWRVLSENLDLNRCELAYTWWYEEKQVPGKL